jgi:hypothetical protein
MTLETLIRKGGLAEIMGAKAIANANPANLANDRVLGGSTLATLAPLALANPLQEPTKTDTTTGVASVTATALTKIASVDPGGSTPQQPAPATVHCRDCAEFEPGPTHWAGGLGKCARTADGRPPVASRGYGVCFPDAPRQCSDYKEPKS